MKLLTCATCKNITVHSFVDTRYMIMSFISIDAQKHIADGYKDLYQCDVCGTQRIYGAPADPPPAFKRPRGRPRLSSLEQPHAS